jgi:tetratricopeptide (TPR) repeat protein
MADPIALKYRAFISYSHADTNWAKWLHGALEGFTIDKDLVGRDTPSGTIPKTLRPIFRDREDFTAGHSLRELTLAALDSSNALIVICSPASAKSHYVNEEIRLFKWGHHKRPIVPLIVDGKPGDQAVECFPPALRFKIDGEGRITNEPMEVLAADAREEGDGKQLALAKVVAGLLDVSSDDIFRRAERARRRQGRLRSMIGLVIVCLAAGGGFLAWQSRQQQQTIAEVEAIVAKYSVEPSSEDALPDSTQNVTRDSLAQAIATIVAGAARDERYAKALEFLKAGKPEDAASLLKAVAEEREARAASENKQAAEAYATLGTISKLADPNRAREAFAKAVALDPQNARALYWNARLQPFGGGNLEAKRGYEQLLALKTDTDECFACYALVGLGNIAESCSSYSGTLGETEEGKLEIPPVCEGLELPSKYYDESLAAADAFAVAHSGSVFSDVARGIAYDSMGDHLVAQRRTTEALDYFRKSLANADRIAKGEPDNDSWQFNLWVSTMKLGEGLFEDEFESQKQLQETETELAHISTELQQRYLEGLVLARRQSQAHPTHAEWKRALKVSLQRIVMIGFALADKGKHEEAISAYGTVLDIEPDDFTARNFRGLALLETKNYDGAIADFNEALRIKPDNAVVLHNRGRTYWAAGEPEKAFANFDRAVSLDPKLAAAYAYRGRIYEMRGERGKAIADYRKALSVTSNIADATEAKAEAKQRLVALGDSGEITPEPEQKATCPSLPADSPLADFFKEMCGPNASEQPANR